MSEIEKEVTLSDEQMAANANLDAAIQDTPKDAAGGETEAAQDLTANAVDSLAGLLSLVPIGLGFAGLKKTAAVWQESTVHGLSVAVVPVLRKYAWGQKIINFLETGAGVEEMALFAVAMPIGLATYGAVNADMAEKREAASADSQAIKPNPARTKNGIEQANADDIEFMKKDYETRN